MKFLIFSSDVYELKELKAAHQNCVPTSTLEARVKKSEDKLAKEKDELSRVKLELEQLKKDKAVVDAALVEEKRLRAEETKRLQDKLDEDVQRANSVEQQLDELKKKPTQWLA